MAYARSTNWRMLERGVANLVAGTAANTWTLYDAGSIVLGAAGSGFGRFHFDPSNYDAKFIRVRLGVLTNAVAPGVTFTGKLSSITSYNGASNTRPGVATISDIATVQIATPSATTDTKADSTDTAAPSAGMFVLALQTNATIATNAQIDAFVELYVRGA